MERLRARPPFEEASQLIIRFQLCDHFMGLFNLGPERAVQNGSNAGDVGILRGTRGLANKSLEAATWFQPGILCNPGAMGNPQRPEVGL